MIVRLRNVLINNPEKSGTIGIYSIIILVTLLLVIFSIDVNSENYEEYSTEENNCGIINDKKIDILLNNSFLEELGRYEYIGNPYQGYYNNKYHNENYESMSPDYLGKILWEKFKPTGATLYLIMSILILLVVYIADYEIKEFMKNRATLIKYLGIKGLGDINKITF